MHARENATLHMELVWCTFPTRKQANEVAYVTLASARMEARLRVLQTPCRHNVHTNIYSHTRAHHMFPRIRVYNILVHVHPYITALGLYYTPFTVMCLQWKHRLLVWRCKRKRERERSRASTAIARSDVLIPGKRKSAMQMIFKCAILDQQPGNTRGSQIYPPLNLINQSTEQCRHLALPGMTQRSYINHLQPPRCVFFHTEMEMTAISGTCNLRNVIVYSDLHIGVSVCRIE